MSELYSSELEARVAKLEKQMINVNREFELGPVSEHWEQSETGSKPAPPPADE